MHCGVKLLETTTPDFSRARGDNKNVVRCLTVRDHHARL